MMEFLDIRFLGSVLVTLFVIMDPPGAVPVFLGLTGSRPERERSRLALQATVTSFVVIVLFAVVGEQVLSFLKISLPALQGAGGLLLLLMALKLLTGIDQDPTEEQDVNVALVPLGTPLLAGPGAIVATILFARQATGTNQYVSLAIGVVLIHLFIFLALRFSTVLSRLLGKSGISMVTRIVGLLLAAIGVQLLADSVFGFIRLSVG
jgi:multiple antibiotic resistance protein